MTDMDQMLAHAMRLERLRSAADATLAAQARDARGRLLGRRTRRRALRASGVRIPRPMFLAPTAAVEAPATGA